MRAQYDLAVIGLGIYGASVAAEAASRGRRVLAVDQLEPQNDRNSSHGTSRIFRFTTLEHASYVARARRAAELWEKLDVVANSPLLSRVGFALIADGDVADQRHHGVRDVVSRARAIASRYGITHSVMSGTDLVRSFPDLSLNSKDEVFFEPDAFIVNPERAISTLMEICRASNTVDVVTGSAARVVSKGSESYVKIGDQLFEAAHIAICCGPWSQAQILGRTAIPVRILPQFTYKVPFKDTGTGWRLPAFAHLKEGQPLLYGMPPVADSSQAKFGVEQSHTAVEEPDSKFVSDTLRTQLRTAASARMRGLAPATNISSAVADLCFYSATADGLHHVKDVSPGVSVFACCSGHGFKYAPAVAEAYLDKIAGNR